MRLKKHTRMCLISYCRYWMKDSLQIVLGRKVDFRNTIIIMTSNIGARQLKDFGQGVGFSTTAKINQADAHSRGVIENALKRAFAPEFLNRVDDVVVFNHLVKKRSSRSLILN